MATREDEVLWEGNPHWLGMIGWYIKWAFFALIVGIPFLIAAYLGRFSTALAVVIIIALLAFVFAIGWIRRATTSYKVTERLVCQAQGILNRDWDTTPISRLQDISVTQSLFQRMLGVGMIEFDNAAEGGALGKSFVWWGIRKPRSLSDLVNSIRSGSYDEEGLDDDPGRGGF